MTMIGGMMIGWAIGDAIMGKFTVTSAVLMAAGVAVLVLGVSQPKKKG